MDYYNDRVGSVFDLYLILVCSFIFIDFVLSLFSFICLSDI